MKYSECLFACRYSYTVRYDSELLHDLLEGKDTFLDTSEEFRTSLILALLKLHDILNEAVLDDNLEYDSQFEEIILKEDLFRTPTFKTREDWDDWSRLYQMYHLSFLDEWLSPQSIEDGLATLYQDISHIRFVCMEGTLDINNRKVICNTNLYYGDPLLIFRKYSYSFSKSILANILYLIDTITKESYYAVL